MTEFELKLEIPAARLNAVETAVCRGQVTHQRLQAIYFDTPKGLLAAQGVVVRLRKEGRQWVQTAKAPGSRPLERLEHNVALGTQPAARPDLARHEGTAVGACIGQALGLDAGDAFPDLVPVYATNIVRLTRNLRFRGALVEIALDRGQITAGENTLPVGELELELKRGPAASAVTLAANWCLKHGLWLSSVSKSMKGERLAMGQAFGPAMAARAPRFARHASGREMAAEVVAACLDQVLGNASDVASGCQGDGHIHQLRVGLRRLRTALRELEPMAGSWGGHWEESLSAVFRDLGMHRDRDYLLHKLQGQIEAAGGPPLDWRGGLGELPNAADSVRSPAFQQSLLGLIGFVHASAVPGESAQEAPAKALRKRLGKLHKQVLSEGKHFLALPEPEQHALRKRLKRLRYLAEFSQPLFSRRKAQAYLDALKPLQDALGTYQDEVAGLQAWQGLSGHDPRALFGTGWLSARREMHVQDCAQACKAFAKQARPFWD